MRKLDKRLQSFWELESIGIFENEEQVYQQFTDHIDYKEGQYEVALPWIINLPDNYDLSVRRLRKLLKRLEQEPEILKAYDAVIKEQLQKGIVQVVEEPEKADGERVHYLPHHPVICGDKNTTKIRVVHDASAKSTGASLNECLHTGPKLHQQIIDILVTFRSYTVALAADIEKAFLVAPPDGDVLRFLWCLM